MSATNYDDLTDALLTASRALVAVAARSLAAVDGGVTLPQYRALVVLAARGPQTVGQLAEEIGVHPSTATRLCDRLVARSLVTRTQGTDNRRETHVALTSLGADVVAKVTERRRDEISAIVRRIPRAVRQPTIIALEEFARAAGEIPDRSWSLGWSR